MNRKNYIGQVSTEEKNHAAPHQQEIPSSGRDRLHTVEEVALLFQFSVKSIYQLVHRGKIPYVKVSGALRFRMSDLEAWIEENTFRPRPRVKRARVNLPTIRKSSRSLTDVERLVEQSREKYLDR